MKYTVLLILFAALLTSCSKQCNDVVLEGRLLMDIEAAGNYSCSNFDDGIVNDNHISGRNYLIMDENNVQYAVVGEFANDIIGKMAPGQIVIAEGLLCRKDFEIASIKVKETENDK